MPRLLFGNWRFLPAMFVGIAAALFIVGQFRGEPAPSSGRELSGGGVQVKSSTVQADQLSIVPTELRLQFNKYLIQPNMIGEQNVWRWAWSNPYFGVKEDDKTKFEFAMWEIFVTFDKPVPAKQISVETSAKTTWRILDYTTRSAVVVFDSEMDGHVATIRVVQ
jgi:hypothetical protein